MCEQEEFLRMGEAQKRLGLSKTTLRNYEKKGILVPVKKLPGSNHRLYSLEQIDWFYNVVLNNEAIKSEKTVL